MKELVAMYSIDTAVFVAGFWFGLVAGACGMFFAWVVADMFMNDAPEEQPAGDTALERRGP